METCNFHRLQRLSIWETFDVDEEEDQLFFHLHPDKSLHILTLNLGWQPPAWTQRGMQLSLKHYWA